MAKAQPRKEKEGPRWSQKDQSIDDEKEEKTHWLTFPSVI